VCANISFGEAELVSHHDRLLVFPENVSVGSVRMMERHAENAEVDGHVPLPQSFARRRPRSSSGETPDE
jgi:hypothetical protein